MLGAGYYWPTYGTLMENEGLPRGIITEKSRKVTFYQDVGHTAQLAMFD